MKYLFLWESDDFLRYGTHGYVVKLFRINGEKIVCKSLTEIGGNGIIPMLLKRGNDGRECCDVRRVGQV